jgi:glycosyltransferase involved in cell wall biosynthesis
MLGHPDASVIVLSYNASRTIRRPLSSLLAQTARRYEIIVVDSGTDGTAEIVRDEFPAVRLVKLPRRAYPGEARNTGVAHAQGAIIAYLAADCTVAPDWLERRLAAHRAGYAVVGGSVGNANPDTAASWAGYFLEYFICFPGRPRCDVHDREIYNVSYPRTIFDRYGPYATDVIAGEDTVFNRRILANGERMLFDPLIRMQHENPDRIGAFLAHQIGHGRDYVRICARYGAGGMSLTGGPAKNLKSNLSTLLVSPARKQRRILGSVLRYNRDYLPHLLRALPLTVLGAYAWSYGVAAELLRTTPTAAQVCQHAPPSRSQGAPNDPGHPHTGRTSAAEERV